MPHCSPSTDGAFASLTYNGYGHFDSDEFMGWIGEMGQKKQPHAGTCRRDISPIRRRRVAAKAARNYGGPDWKPAATRGLLHQHFGTILVSCEHGRPAAAADGRHDLFRTAPPGSTRCRRRSAARRSHRRTLCGRCRGASAPA